VTVDELVRAGRLEPVESDVASARISIEEARRHLASAVLIASSDPNGAYALLYDAARKAIAAHMLAAGYRATVRPRAHEAVGLYGVERITSGERPESIHHFDRMRRKRNRTEYGVRTFGAAELEADLTHARAIVDAVAVDLEEFDGV
jgi:hypothetical protein